MKETNQTKTAWSFPPDFDTLKYVILQYTDFHYFINFRTPKWVSQLKKSVYLHHVCAQEK